ncbi:MAG: hypothetical protein J5881_03405 [Clostridia bacterium]|nr:hypothetical protein [Clostridia bacterium]
MALVITIIVLLILAGISISALTGSDSAPAKGNLAKQKNNIGVEKDAIGIVVNNQLIKAYDDIYIKENKNIRITDATNSMGQSVIDAVFIHYGGEARKTTDTTIMIETQSGEVSIKIEQQKNQDALITLKTRDLEEHGRIELIGGQLSWDKVATN